MKRDNPGLMGGVNKMLDRLAMDRMKKMYTKSSNDKAIKEGRKIIMHNISGGGTIGLTDFNKMLTKYTGWIYAATTRIAESISSGTLELTRREGKKMREVPDHEFLDLWDNPNPNFTKEFIYQLHQLFLELTGNSYWQFVLNGMGKPVEVWMIPPNMITPKREKGSANFIDYYQYEYKGNKRRYSVEEIMHIKKPNPLSFLFGYAPLYACSNSVLINEYMDTYHLNFFRKGARPDIAITTEQKLNPQKREENRKAWKEIYAGNVTEFEIAMLDMGLKVDTFGPNMKDLEFPKGMEMIRERIIAVYGTTLSKLGIVKDVNRANAEALEESYQRDTVMPRLKFFSGYIQQFILRKYYDKLLHCRFLSTVPSDRKIEIQERKVNIMTGVTLINEERERIGKEPKPYGEFAWLSGNLNPVPVDYKGFIPEEEKKKAEQEIKGLKSKVDTSQIRISPIIKPVLNTKEKRLAYWYKYKKNQTLLYAQTYKALQKYFIALGREWEKLIKAGYKKGIKSFDVNHLTPPLKEWNTKLLSTLNPYWKHYLSKGAADIIADFSIGISYTVPKSAVIEYLALRENLITGALHKSFSTIMEDIAAGIDSGETTKEVTRRLTGQITTLSTTRADLIAITELNTGENRGHWEVIKRIDADKQWVTAGDERVRKSHQDMDGEVQSPDQPFSNGLQYPCDPRCRCNVVPVSATIREA